MSGFFERIYQPKHQTPEFHASMGMRGFAVFGVFMAHYTDAAEKFMPTGTLTHEISAFFEPYAHVCVKVFFLITAFLLYSAMIKGPRPFFPYLKRRLARIYPTFLLVFLLYLALSFAFPEQSKLPEGIWASVQYIIANLLFLPGVFAIEPVITVAWTLSYDLIFYFTLPAVLFGFSMWNRSMYVRLLIMAALYGAVYLFAFEHYVGTAFIVGMIMAELWRNRKTDTAPLRIAIPVLAFWAVGNLVYLFSINNTFDFQLGGKINHVLMMLAWAPVMFYCMLPGNIVYNFFAWRPMRYLGNMVFSIYLIHGLTIHFAFMVLAKVMPMGAGEMSSLFFWSFSVVVFAFSWIVATGLYITVERPLSVDGVGIKELSKQTLAGLKRRPAMEPAE